MTRKAVMLSQLQWCPRTLPAKVFHGDYSENPQFREYFQNWMNQLWAEKDKRIGELRKDLS